MFQRSGTAGKLAQKSEKEVRNLFMLVSFASQTLLRLQSIVQKLLATKAKSRLPPVNVQNMNIND